MGIPNIMNIGRSSLVASKAAISTTGHNIANANTEGYARQRVHQSAEVPQKAFGKNVMGAGVRVDGVNRINDDYLEKQLRNGSRDLNHYEEKDLALKQVEDIFNEMNGDGLNRLMSNFFNEFRRLANDPSSEAVRQSVREASQSVVNDFKRLRSEVEDVRKHIDSRVEAYTGELNALVEEMKELNAKIQALEVGGGNPNDLLDRRDQVAKQMGSYLDLAMRKDEKGNYAVDIRGIGPLLQGPIGEKFYVERGPADERGKPENALDIRTTASAQASITHSLKGGKLGALLEIRDKSISTVLDRLDDLAFGVTRVVNEIHQQGFTRDGLTGVKFFGDLTERHRAAEFITLAEPIRQSANNIAAAAMPESPGDNRVAIALSGLQSHKLMNGGQSTFDDWYNSIVSNVGIASAKNKASLNQQKNIVTQLTKLRDQISGVSIDEETTNLLQFQQTFDASAKVIQIADEMLKTVLEIKR